MYHPNYTYTDRLVSNLIKIETGKTVINSTDLKYEIRSKLSEYAKALDMMYIAKMLGYEITLKEGEKVAEGKRLESITDERSIVLANMRNSLEFNRSDIADTYAEADLSVLLHLNKIIITGWRESWDARIRNFQEAVDERYDDMAGMRDMSITENQRESEVLEAIEWYKNASPTVPAMIRIGVLLFRIIEIAPFLAGNKLTYISFLDYMLYKNGYSNQIYMSTVRNFDTNFHNFFEAYRISKQNFDLTYWLEIFTQCVLNDLNLSRQEMTKFSSEEEKKKQQPFLDLNKRQIKILKYLQAVPYIKREDYCHVMEVSTMTAFRDLNDLVRKKLLRIDGQGRGTKYILASR